MKRVLKWILLKLELFLDDRKQTQKSSKKQRMHVRYTQWNTSAINLRVALKYCFKNAHGKLKQLLTINLTTRLFYQPDKLASNFDKKFLIKCGLGDTKVSNQKKVNIDMSQMNQ